MWPYMTETTTTTDLLKLRKLLYLGPWDHIEPVNNTSFKNVKEFIYIDTQPRSEVDGNRKYPYNHSFLEQLMLKCDQCGFILKKTTVLNSTYCNDKIKNENIIQPIVLNPSLYEFENADLNTKIRYYISTNFRKNMCAELAEDMRSSDGIIVSGYFPHSDIFAYFPIPKVFIGYSETVYPIDKDDTESLEENNNFMHTIVNNNNNWLTRYFSDYYLCSNETNHMQKCEDIYELAEYSHKEWNKHYILDTIELNETIQFD